MIKKFVLLIIKIYQKFISPLLGKHCRFYPSCSEYTYLAIEKYGVLFGLYKAFIRITKCHPLNPGGADYP